MRLMLVGLVLAAGLVVLGLYAAGEDDYYGDGTTRWEHATRDGGTAMLSTLFVVPALIACGFLLLGIARRRLWATPIELAAGAVYVVCMGFAWMLLTGGH